MGCGLVHVHGTVWLSTCARYWNLSSCTGTGAGTLSVLLETQEHVVNNRQELVVNNQQASAAFRYHQAALSLGKDVNAKAIDFNQMSKAKLHRLAQHPQSQEKLHFPR